MNPNCEKKHSLFYFTKNKQNIITTKLPCKNIKSAPQQRNITTEKQNKIKQKKI